MGELPNNDSNDTNVSVTKEAGTRTLLIAAADTTWRMFVPAIGFTLIGVALDGIWHTKPWLMFGGIVLGFGAAYLLVRRQYMSLKKESH